jgi:hypothetical protein
MSKNETKKIETENELPAPKPMFDDDGFCVAEGVKRIENNTEHLINLPPVESAPDFPNGIKLWPGITTVPLKYWAALEAYEPGTPLRCSPNPEDREKYKPSNKRPGLDTIKYLLTPTKIVKADGTFFGPQITVYDPDQCDRPDGAPLPDTLAAYNDQTALRLIANVNNRDVLEKWARAETDPRRGEVRQAATTKLATLR